jgi:hypothetical protein
VDPSTSIAVASGLPPLLVCASLPPEPLPVVMADPVVWPPQLAKEKPSMKALALAFGVRSMIQDYRPPDRRARLGYKCDPARFG